MAQEAQSSFELCWIFFTTLSDMSYDRWHRKHRTFELSWTPKKSTTLRGIVSETLTLRTLRLKSQAQVGQWIPPNKRGRTPKCSASWGIVSDTHSIKSPNSLALVSCPSWAVDCIFMLQCSENRGCLCTPETRAGCSTPDFTEIWQMYNTQD